jgi:hypothetical protein
LKEHGPQLLDVGLAACSPGPVDHLTSDPFQSLNLDTILMVGYKDLVVFGALIMFSFQEKLLI